MFAVGKTVQRCANCFQNSKPMDRLIFFGHFVVVLSTVFTVVYMHRIRVAHPSTAVQVTFFFVKLAILSSALGSAVALFSDLGLSVGMVVFSVYKPFVHVPLAWLIWQKWHHLSDMKTKEDYEIILKNLEREKEKALREAKDLHGILAKYREVKDVDDLIKRIEEATANTKL